jgi:hypothetical protein
LLLIPLDFLFPLLRPFLMLFVSRTQIAGHKSPKFASLRDLRPSVV